jgi:hypothetical protein
VIDDRSIATMMKLDDFPVLPSGNQAASDRILCALLYLLVHLATRGGESGHVLAIGRHLELLSAHHQATPALRRTAPGLRDDWLRQVALPAGSGVSVKEHAVLLH